MFVLRVACSREIIGLMLGSCILAGCSLLPPGPVLATLPGLPPEIPDALCQGAIWELRGGTNLHLPASREAMALSFDRSTLGCQGGWWLAELRDRDGRLLSRLGLVLGRSILADRSLDSTVWSLDSSGGLAARLLELAALQGKESGTINLDRLAHETRERLGVNAWQVDPFPLARDLVDGTMRADALRLPSPLPCRFPPGHLPPDYTAGTWYSLDYLWAPPLQSASLALPTGSWRYFDQSRGLVIKLQVLPNGTCRWYQGL